VEDYLFATSQIAQTTLRSVLASRSWTNCSRSGTRSTRNSSGSSTSTPSRGASSERGGGEVHRPATGDAAAMAKQAEAEREKRAKIIHAEGELLASEKLARRRHHRLRAGDHPAPLPANPDRDRHGEETRRSFSRCPSTSCSRSSARRSCRDAGAVSHSSGAADIRSRRRFRLWRMA